MSGILQINTTVGYASPGKIANDIGDLLIGEGIGSHIAYGRLPESKSKSTVHRIGDNWDIYSHVLSTRLFDNHGFASKEATKKLIKQIDNISPDLIQLHNLHGYYINIEELFNYFKKISTPIVWTFHDAWPLTGHCTHFEQIGCTKWKTACEKCPQTKAYPSSLLFDNSKKNYLRKKRLFTYPENLTIITPSTWLANLAKQSFLKSYEVEVIPNGVNQNIFKPQPAEQLIQKYNLENKFIAIGVSSVWDKNKGLYDFFEVSKKLLDDEVLIMVGLTKKQLKLIPSNIIGIERTNSADELAQLYSLADVFVNLTYADTFPTTNLEALSCGTPIITYNTGGSVESVTKNTGVIVVQGAINEVTMAIGKIKEKGKKHYEKECITLAQDRFNKNKQYNKYIELYKTQMGI